MFRQGQRVRVNASLVPRFAVKRWIVYGRSKRQGHWICHGIADKMTTVGANYPYRLVIEAEFSEQQIEPYEGAQK